ncbi:MAG: hypothetical protein ACRDB0_07780 [Paraclostridium sp.]
MVNLFKCKNKKEVEDVMEHLSAQAHAIYKAREEEVMSNLENDTQRIIFMDWFTGGILFEGFDDTTHKHIKARRYRHVSDHDWDTVHGWIMETVCMGMG